VVFDQGESDASELTRALNWEENFNKFRDAIRKDIGSDVPIVIRRLSDTQAILPYIDVVKAQQFNAVKNSFKVGMVTCDVSDGCAVDSSGLHFTQSSFRIIGKKVAEACSALSPVSSLRLSGDINQDHIVNSLDWSIMSSQWLTNNPQADINKDGLVNSLDFAIMSSQWLQTW
jgi:hypothetical protein